MSASLKKIAVVTDDMQSISAYFESALHYMVFTIENSRIIKNELYPKTGNHALMGQEQAQNQSELASTDLPSNLDLASILEPIVDCNVLLARNMDKNAYSALLLRSIQPILSNIPDAWTAVQSYLEGDIVNHLEYLY